MGRVRLHYEWDILGAEKAFKKAIALNPNYADAYDQCAFAMHLQGKIDKRLLHTKKALELDPFSAMINLHAGYSFIWSREFDKMAQQGHKLRALYPDFFGGYFLNGYVHLTKEEFKDAVPLLEKTSILAPMAMTKGLLGLALALNGDQQKVQVILGKIDAIITEQKSGIFFRGLIRAGLGQYELAMKDFEQSYDVREGIFIHMQPWLDFIPSILSDSRMRSLIKRTWMNIPNHHWK
jgi:tetratricopeptide (TPR) repeat protein